MDGGVLPLQGPPGSGKTYAAARMIVQQVEAMKEMVNAFSDYARAPDLDLNQFSIDKLVHYVNETRLDAIAVTNHNVFDAYQYRVIRDTLSVPVFPGIEINLCEQYLHGEQSE